MSVVLAVCGVFQSVGYICFLFFFNMGLMSVCFFYIKVLVLTAKVFSCPNCFLLFSFHALFPGELSDSHMNV